MSSLPNPLAAPLAAIARKSIGWSIFLSIVLILAGLFAIFVPSVSGIGITVIVGWLLTISGITHLIFAWKVHSTGRKLWELLLGAVYLFVGIDLIIHPLAGLVSLTFVLALYLVFEGVLELILAFRLRPAAGWTWTLLDGIVTLILAFMIWYHWPTSSVWAIGTIVGISMVFSGFSRLMISLAAKRALQHVA